MVNGFVVVTFRYTNDSLTTDKHLELLPQQHGKELARSWQGVGRELGIDLDVLSTICEFCLEPKSLLEIADHLNLHDRYKMKKKYIDPILGKLIRMTIPEKPNSSKQRYVTICRKEDQE